MESWMVAHAEIELKVGGLMRTHYDPKGALGDPKTIVNQILSFEPERMLSIKVFKPPDDFPLPEAVKDTWTVIYFQPLEPGMTNVRIIGLGFSDEPDSQKLKEFFLRGNAWTLEQLQKKFWPTCASPGMITNPAIPPEPVRDYHSLRRRPHEASGSGAIRSRSPWIRATAGFARRGRCRRSDQACHAPSGSASID
jgi:uncharacterized protein YndB with AHSA1/START domain